MMIKNAEFLNALKTGWCLFRDIFKGSAFSTVSTRKPKMPTGTLESKMIAAHQHGRMDFHTGAPCEPRIPPDFITGLSSIQQNFIMQAWVDGWLEAFVNESRTKNLPGGMPA